MSHYGNGCQDCLGKEKNGIPYEPAISHEFILGLGGTTIKGIRISVFVAAYSK